VLKVPFDHQPTIQVICQVTSGKCPTNEIYHWPYVWGTNALNCINHYCLLTWKVF